MFGQVGRSFQATYAPKPHTRAASHFLEKNDMMLPWPTLPAAFFALGPEDDGVDVGVAFLAGG